mmetsp:Transcript_14896/g.23702  ORF Transcript_14896/g.23702 Transcript_14896/m.23702 type:complete len:81 (-) Transcript_14896:1263-1505(-)
MIVIKTILACYSSVFLCASFGAFLCACIPYMVQHKLERVRNSKLLAAAEPLYLSLHDSHQRVCLQMFMHVPAVWMFKLYP